MPGIPWTVTLHHPLAGINMGGLVALAGGVLLHADGASAAEKALHGRGQEGRADDGVTDVIVVIISGDPIRGSCGGQSIAVPPG